MKCKICKSTTNILFESLVLNKYQVGYHSCPNCGFIQTDEPFWLNEAYNNAITDLDVGLVSRNLAYLEVIEKIITKNFDYKRKFLDYAGGYGLFVRLMRDKGFDFYREDKYCENIFAKNFDIEDLGNKVKFEALTAFEVFEHLENPLAELEKMLELSDTVIFSTELQPDQEIRNVEDWWYFTPETGQHISFYKRQTLQYVADKYDLHLFSRGNLHLLSKSKFNSDPLEIGVAEGIEKPEEIKSLIQADFELAKDIIKKTIEIKNEPKKFKKEQRNNELVERLALISARLDYIENKLDSTNRRLAVEQIELDLTKSELSATTSELDSTKSELSATASELDSTKSELSATASELDSTKSELSATASELDRTKNELFGVYSSREWKAAMMLQKIVKKIIPNGSARRKIVAATFGIVKKSKKVLKNKKKKRKINTSSRKIAYIDHSYHNKTKSNAFLIDYLKKFYDVEIVLDESWLGKPFLDLSFIDESYLGVIFFQNLPSREILDSIKNDNLIFFPMYDGVRHDFEFWDEYRDLKIVNFSTTLHNKLSEWGLDSLGVQFFPELQGFHGGKKNEVFFWQRLTRININAVSKLLGDEKVKVHIHKAIDPHQEFIKPSVEEEKRFNITYSDWFETREEMWDKIKQKGIYIAPREHEGIGMSFLEAMSMGKAVIAVDNPTMNEYIEHGKTGYLFDLANPQKIDLSEIESVQKNTYKFMQEGFEKWEKDKKKIIDFIVKK